MKPGTVSKILWHFTGGPDWDPKLKKQKKNPKDLNSAYKILCLILESKFLKLSSYNEIVNVTIPEVSKFDFEMRKRIIEKDVKKEIKSSKVVCLADIPIQHIEYHAIRYGKFAIGFHREAAIKNNFNPVFYSLNNSNVINSIYTGFTSINSIETSSIEGALSDIESDASDIQTELDDNNIDDYDTSNITSLVSDIENEISDISNSKEAVAGSLEDLVAFVKTFNTNEFDSIYCEREWRALKQFNFSQNEIAMVILPKTGGFYEDLIKKRLLPKNIPIIPWEDIIEH